jgi:hypothetical protein
LGGIYCVGIFRYTLGIPRYQPVLSSPIFYIVYLVREPSVNTDIYMYGIRFLGLNYVVPPFIWVYVIYRIWIGNL